MGPWELVVEKGWALGKAQVRQREMLAVLDAQDCLMAYLRLSTHQRDGNVMGIGLHPDRCGRGLGAAVVELGVREHRRRLPGQPLWMEVRRWNTRAIRCYQRAGFRIVGQVDRVTPPGPGTFVVMRYAEPP